jgi:diguanylate cyclase (GGDEF)-like protein
MRCTDQLTDLPNRGRLLSELTVQLRGCLDDGGWVALLVLDVDRFKLVNETHGHSAGDDLLLRLSDRLRTLLPEGALLARLSADEFGLLLHLDAASFKHAHAAAEAFAARLCEAARRPFLTRYEPYETTASVGIVLSEGSNVNAETVLQYAGLALALAKEAGGDSWRVFDPALLESSKSRYYAESALRDGLRASEFELYFQPKVDMGTGELCGAEALIRWNRLGQGTLGPERIVPVAERSTLILALGEWVLREACRCAQRLQAEGLLARLGTLSVNVSPRQFQQSDFVSRTRSLMQEMGTEPRHLCLELTETALATDAEHVLSSLQLLKDQGFGIAIDDFGTGYSSFAYLQRFPVDELKIDKTFVDGIEGSERSLAIVRAMLAMAHALRLSVVAEGIETPAQRALLSAAGCVAGQGYLFARPMPLDTFIGWLRAREPEPTAQAALAPAP